MKEKRLNTVKEPVKRRLLGFREWCEKVYTPRKRLFELAEEKSVMWGGRLWGRE